jgi:hypothetical protein
MNISATKTCLQEKKTDKLELPDKIEDPADIDLEGVPPRIGIFLVQHLDQRNEKSVLMQTKEEKGERVVSGETEGDPGSSRGANEVIAPAFAMSISSFPKC